MDYTTLLNLKKEPFSISPDPSFFYYSKDYQECLQKLEISIRLRRGLNIILGDVGTGKTTLSRALIQLFQGYEEFRFHLILDPSFNSEYEFLLTLIKIFNIPIPAEKTCLAFKEAIRTNLLREGLERKRVVVLIIDETQKMDYPFLELLRDFLNFETNEYKLLQLVLLGQMEFLEKIQGKKNFMDRVNMIYFLKPLNQIDTREMIEFRLRKAGFFSREPLFTKEAYKKIFDYSQGYPRKIVNLCHHCLLMMLIRKQQVVDKQIVDVVVKSLFPDTVFPEQKKSGTMMRWGKLAGSLAALFVLIIVGIFGFLHFGGTSSTRQADKTSQKRRQADRRTHQADAPKKNIQSQPAGSLPQPPASPAKTDSVPSASPAKAGPEGAPSGTVADPQSVPSGADQKASLPGRKTDQKALPQDRRAEQKADQKNDLLSPLSPIRKTGEGSSDSQQSSSGEAITRAREGGYEVIAGKGDFISKIALRLYGREVTDDILASIQKVNPHISNMDIITPGQKVYFPVPDGKKRGGKGSYIYGVQVERFSTVAEAQGCIKKLSSIDSRAYIEKENTSDQGETYSVVIGPFAKITGAWDVIDELKKKDLNNSRVMIINQD
ncbi:MAG: AAA family ATPase [bacterium]